MYTFNRRVRIAPGKQNAALEWAMDMTERVRDATSLDVTLHTQVFSPEMGELVFSAFVPDLATLETANDKLMTVTMYLSEVERSADLLDGGAIDGVQRIVFPDTMDTDIPDHVGTYTTVVSSACQPGRISQGVLAGIELAQKATEITGHLTSVLVNRTGAFSGISWATVLDDVHAVDAANAALDAAEDWAPFIDERVGGTYVADPEVSRQLIYRRIA